MNAEPKKAAEQPRPSLRKALKGAPQRLWRLIYHNWPWKLLALFLALCLWAGLITQDPTLTRERVFTDVTVSVVGADTLRRNSGLIVLSGLEDENLTARLRVDVPQREYNTVTASNYNPRVDLTRITEGTCTISNSDVTMGVKGETFQISLRDADGNKITGLLWVSSDLSVCSVDGTGVVKAEGKGTAYISTTYNGVTYQCIVRCNIK